LNRKWLLISKIIYKTKRTKILNDKTYEMKNSSRLEINKVLGNSMTGKKISNTIRNPKADQWSWEKSKYCSVYEANELH
jgi:hypothetical protein